MSTAAVNSYDEVPYPSYPYASTHPAHLATIALLLGLEPPPRPYRVLELGCAAGGNLIPMAFTHPDCQFVGIDYSDRQIADGHARLERCGLDNVELQAVSIAEVDERLGKFDYILCHGVYSWVAADIQSKILSLCQQLLSDSGIAYISYNTQPGWRQRGALRDMMQYHVGRLPLRTPAERIGQARGLLDFLVKATRTCDDSYAQLLREQQSLLAKHSDAYIYHEHLEQHNQPLWFLDFCQRLEAHELRYLGEADFSSMVAAKALPGELQEELDRLAPNLIEKEQYTDFIRNRSFRQTLVCRAHQRPNYAVRGQRLRPLWGATPGRIRPAEPALDQPQQPWQLEIEGGPSLNTPVRSTQLAFELLCQAWPERISIAALVERVAGQLAVPAYELESLRSSIEVALLTAFSSVGEEMLELSCEPLSTTAEASESLALPRVSKLVRLQAADGLPIVNRRHDLFHATPIDRRILPLLDGRQDAAAILERLLEQFSSGDLRVTDEHDAPIADQSRVQLILQELVAARLATYRRSSLVE